MFESIYDKASRGRLCRSSQFVLSDDLPEYDIFVRSYFESAVQSRKPRSWIDNISRLISTKPCFIRPYYHTAFRVLDEEIEPDEVEDDLHMNIYAECRVKGNYCTNR